MAKFSGSALALLSAALLFTSPVAAGKDDTKKASMSTEEKEMMDKMMKAGAPGPEHKKFADLVGKWNVDVKEWQKSGAEPKASKATATYKSIYGGRFLVEEFKSKMGKMAFEGKMLLGFNNLSKKYQSVWIENMGTSIMTMEGTFDDATKEFTSSGSYIDPMDGQTKVLKIVGKMIDKDTRQHEFYNIAADGKSTKWMEMTYRRSK